MSWPTILMEQKLQEDSLRLIFSRISLQEECLRVEEMRGSPRYLEGREPMTKPKILAMFIWVITGVLKKKIWDLSLLIEVIEASKKV